MANILQTTLPYGTLEIVVIHMSLNFHPTGPIDNVWIVLHVMVQCRAGDKSSSEPVTVDSPLICLDV